MLIPHVLRASSHQYYALLVCNTWVVWFLEEKVTKRGEIIRVNIYASKSFFIQKKFIFKDHFSPVF